jgi:hypothetical protein
MEGHIKMVLYEHDKEELYVGFFYIWTRVNSRIKLRIP